MSSKSRETPSRRGIFFDLPVFIVSKGLSHISLLVATSRISYCIEFTHPRPKFNKRTPHPGRRPKGRNLEKNCETERSKPPSVWVYFHSGRLSLVCSFGPRPLLFLHVCAMWGAPRRTRLEPWQMQKLLLLRVLLSSKTRSVFRVLSSKTCFVNHWAAWLYFVNFQVVVFCILLIFQVVYFVNFCILLILQHIINSAPGLCF